MATPITHIVLSEKIRPKILSDKVVKDFIIGTSFPDIRHFKVIKREETHYNDLKIEDLQKDTSFQAGLKFHSILDLAREKFMLGNGIYKLCPQSTYIKKSIKILEDKIFYNYISDWEKYIEYFDDILNEEKGYNIHESAIREWHDMLQEYFYNSPNIESISKYLFKIGHTKEEVNEINYNISIIEKEKRVLNLIDRLYQEFDFII